MATAPSSCEARFGEHFNRANTRGRLLVTSGAVELRVSAGLKWSLDNIDMSLNLRKNTNHRGCRYISTLVSLRSG